ncbi:hypothetical protein [Brachybacterium sp. UNK5269]|uniref:hypothetical protein n=1 Tax=Brachybacterium sp. UNK5269 TaxID=3408576 RepID=UPI003BAF0C36
MGNTERDIEAEDNARYAEFAKRFEPGEYEVEGTSVVRLPRELSGYHTALWRHLRGERTAPQLYGRAVREAAVVACERDGEFLGVVLTPVGALSARDPMELEEQVRAFAAREWGIEADGIQVVLRLVASSEVEATLIKELFGL